MFHSSSTFKVSVSCAWCKSTAAADISYICNYYGTMELLHPFNFTFYSPEHKNVITMPDNSQGFSSRRKHCNKVCMSNLIEFSHNKRRFMFCAITVELQWLEHLKFGTMKICSRQG